MKKWEYRVRSLITAEDHQRLDEFLSQHGKYGWELVQIIKVEDRNHLIFVMKREIPEPVDNPIEHDFNEFDDSHGLA